MASIYDTVLSWSAATTYNKYNIVLGSDNRYYYSIIDNNVGAGNNPTTLSNLGVDWDGYISLNGNLIPDFWWKPSYNAKIDNKPRIRYNQFGNGYQQRIPDGLNTSLVEFNLTFENRSELETVSILHFLRQRNGQESFIYNLPTIYSKSSNNLNTRFICPEWGSSYISYNNYTIDCKFIEVPI
jgi:phage-related protein